MVSGVLSAVIYQYIINIITVVKSRFVWIYFWFAVWFFMKSSAHRALSFIKTVFYCFDKKYLPKIYKFYWQVNERLLYLIQGKRLFTLPCGRINGIAQGGIFFGITLMLLICVQFCIFPLNYMSTLYFVFGLAQALTAFLALKNSSAADFAHSR